MYRIRKERPDVFDKLEGKSFNSIILCIVSYFLIYDQSIWMEVCEEERVSRNCVTRLSARFNNFRLCVDILKALCLGAKAVGLGRPYLYAQSVCTVLAIA